MRVALYGRPQVAAVLVECAALAQSAGAAPVWRRDSVFTRDQCEPFDLVIALAGSPQAAVIAAAYGDRGVPTVLVPADGLTPEALEALHAHLGLPPTSGEERWRDSSMGTTSEGAGQPRAEAEASATSDAAAPASMSAPVASPPVRRRRG
jgi:hypothetical protein